MVLWYYKLGLYRVFPKDGAKLQRMIILLVVVLVENKFCHRKGDMYNNRQGTTRLTSSWFFYVDFTKREKV